MGFFNVTDNVRLLNTLNLLAIPSSVAFFLSCLMEVGRPVSSSSSELSELSSPTSGRSLAGSFGIFNCKQGFDLKDI